MPSQKCKVFIGSSGESEFIARAIQNELKNVAEVQIWSQGLFRPGTATLDELLRATNGFDFGVFVFAPDDIAKIRDKDYSVVRDNVLFELGMFVGKLGPLRSLFVVPDKRSLGDFHLPSDLNGITSIAFDPGNTNVQMGVAPAVFEIIKAIKEQGPLQSKQITLFESKMHALPVSMVGNAAYILKDNKKVGDQAKGALTFGNNGQMTVNRTNEHGRFEIHYRPYGPGKPSFKKSLDVPRRALHVTCEVKAEGSSRNIRFVAKDEKAGQWLDKSDLNIDPGDWVQVDFYLWVSATKDFLFRIDDEKVTAKNSKLYIRNLIIVEEQI